MFNEKNLHDNLDLRVQIEELKGILRANDLHYKDKELKFSKIIENYEQQITRITDENKQMKDRYEKILEAQRKLEKLNSNLEDKLLKIVEKYESEQKNLLDELTLAHSRLIETRLTMTELENEKESYREDCNIAVTLLQRNPSEFVHHSYNALPVNLKERLKSYLSNEEITKLESDNINHSEPIQDVRSSNSFFKLPVFQPTAAAAMMYNIQNLSLQQRKIKKSETNDQSNFCSINLEDDYDNNNKKTPAYNSNNNDINKPNGKISSDLIAQVLKKESDSKSNKSFKLFPYICLKCKKNIIICDSPAQTNLDDLNDTNLKILIGHNKSIFSDQLITRSKTIANNLSQMNSSSLSLNDNNNFLRSTSHHHQKCASTDLSSLNNINKSLSATNVSHNSNSNTNNSNNLVDRTNSRNRVDQWNNNQVHNI